MELVWLEKNSVINKSNHSPNIDRVPKCHIHTPFKSLGSLFQCWTNLLEEKFFLISNANLNWRLSCFVLPPGHPSGQSGTEGTVPPVWHCHTTHRALPPLAPESLPRSFLQDQLVEQHLPGES